MNRTRLSEFKKKAFENPEVESQYNSLSSAFNLRKKLIALRQEAGLTQEQIATVLHTQKSNISRLESVNATNSPKLSTLEHYAHAVGYDLEINFIPIQKHT